MRRTIVVGFGVAVVVAAAAIPWRNGLHAESTQKHVHKTTSSYLRISPTGRVHTQPSIDGAEHPELIPDTLAYHHFLHEVAAQAAPGADPKRLAGYIKHLRLGRADTPRIQALIQVARAYKQGLDQLAATNDVYARSDASARVRFAAAKMRLLQDTLDTLSTQLRPEDKASLDDYVRTEIKRRIKMMP